MSIVQAGKQFTAIDLKQTAGDMASHLHNLSVDGTSFGAQLASFVDADLVTLGLTQAEIDAIKGFFIGDLPAVTAALDASTWLRQLIGTGV